MIGIYKITNVINGKVYIGQSIDIETRWYRHTINMQKEEKATTILYKAFRKYGIENFSFEILDECIEEELDYLERKYIEFYRSYIGFEDAHGYNMTIGGGGSRGYKHNEETKVIMKERQKECHLRGEEHPLYGIERAEETKEKIRQGRLGKYKGENSAWYGRTHTEETRRKMSESSRGIGHTKEVRQKMSEQRKGGKNARARKVICDNQVFDCVVDCATFYGIKHSTMRAWLNNVNPTPQNFIDLRLRYKGEDDE